MIKKLKLKIKLERREELQQELHQQPLICMDQIKSIMSETVSKRFLKALAKHKHAKDEYLTIFSPELCYL